MEELTRNQTQKLAMIAIYDALTYISMGEAVDVENIVSSVVDAPYEEAPYFVQAATIYAIKDYEEAKKAIEEKMIRWTWERRNRIEQAIYLLSYVHFYRIDKEVDKKVVIDIAVRLARAYEDATDYKFVNAILDKVLTRD